MYKVLPALVAVTALTLNGCAAISSFTGIPVADIQSAAVATCSFLPTAGAIAKLLTTDPAASTAEEVAQLICAAVVAANPTIAPTTSGGAPSPAAAKMMRKRAVVNPVRIVVPVINGVPIYGNFVTIGK